MNPDHLTTFRFVSCIFAMVRKGGSEDKLIIALVKRERGRATV